MLAPLLASLVLAVPTAERLGFEGARFQVVWVDLDAAELRVLWTAPHGTPLRSFAAAQKTLDGKAVALTNAGIFEKGEHPSGLLVSRGVEKTPLNTKEGAGNFYLKPNGVFVVDAAGAHVVETSEYPALAAGALEATQSGPLLVRAGKIHPSFSVHSSNRVLRSGIGVAGLRKVALVVSEGPIDFHTFARFFLEKLKCEDALYLDGFVSRLYAPALGLTDLSSGPFAGIIAVVPTASPSR